MFRLKIDNLTAFVALTAATAAAATLPRKPPALAITQPSGEEIRLSSFSGKVVAIEFLFVRSPHCLKLVEMLNRLNGELGPQGFQAVAVAFGPDASAGVLAHMVEHFKLTYPVGYTTAEQVDAFLSRGAKEVLKIPQMVVVDRNGIIRATSGTGGDPALEDQSSLRAMVLKLLQEGKGQPGASDHALRDEEAAPVEAPDVQAGEDRETAPDFSLQDSDGVVARLSDYRGKVVLLSFWATWCMPCQAEIPWFNEFGRANKNRGFSVLGIAMDGDWKPVRRYADRQGITYRILLGNNQAVRKYGGIPALPETLLIDRDGRIAAKYVGATSKGKMEREIGALLGLEAGVALSLQ